jgi:putative endonuclease
MVNTMWLKSGDKIRKGRIGEEEALKYLEGKGHRILERNFRAERGEIDLITMDGTTLVFVEAKYGGRAGFGEPEDRVNVRKQRQIGKVAYAYLALNNPGHQDCRFDVVSVVRRDGRTTIRHIEDAFWLQP